MPRSGALAIAIAAVMIAVTAVFTLLVRVPIPDDIVSLRRTDPDAAMHWRRQVRSELGDRMAAGAEVIGFTRDGDYLVRGVQ